MNIKFQHDRKESVREPLRERSQLRQELLQESIAGELCDALLTGMMTGTILTPVNHLELWETTVEIAASIIGAEYGALFILDEQTNELVFEVVLRGASKELKHFSHARQCSGVCGIRHGMRSGLRCSARRK